MGRVCGDLLGTRLYVVFFSSLQVSKSFLILYFNTVVVLSVVRTTPVVKNVSGTARCSSIKCETILTLGVPPSATLYYAVLIKFRFGSCFVLHHDSRSCPVSSYVLSFEWHVIHRSCTSCLLLSIILESMRCLTLWERCINAPTRSLSD